MILTLLATFMCVLLTTDAFDKRKYTETTCDISCSHGGCGYKGCRDKVECPGGGCIFEKCNRPSCKGGLCIFIDCNNAICEGGACDFVEPRETLLPGYCPGDGCTLDGTPHPKMDDNFLSA